MPALDHEVSDATQRVNVNAVEEQAAPQPRRRVAPPRPTPSRRAAAEAARKRRQRNIILGAGIGAGIILIVLLIIFISSLFKAPADDGKILSNVFAAGVNLGGMTQEEAEDALYNATYKTYSVLDMSVKVLDTEVRLTPKDTGAALNVSAVVEEAYNYGRTGSASEQERIRKQAQSTSYTISVLPHLNLNTGYIQQVIDELGAKYSTTRSATSFELQGETPKIKPGKQDTTVAQQTLVVRKGTAEYAMNPDALYQQVMDAYNINIFEVTGRCTETPPEPADFDALYAKYKLYIAPQNATRDEDYEIQKETYGYGITMDALKAIVDQMAYGEEKSVPLYFITPDYTSDNLDAMFEDVLATYTATISTTDDAWKQNLKTVCKALNDVIIQANGEFSFNSIVGQPTAAKGYKKVKLYVGKQLTETEGGGISQAASAIYYCALLADMRISERHSHSYVTDFITAGFDAEIIFGLKDLRFQNNSGSPIRIEATVQGSELRIRFLGTDNLSYNVQIISKTDRVRQPITVYNLMNADNPGGYKDGDVLSAGYEGCDVTTYMVKYDRTSGTKLSETKITTSYYAKRDQVVVKIDVPEPPPTENTDPTQNTDPTETTDPTDTADPTQSDEIVIY